MPERQLSEISLPEDNMMDARLSAEAPVFSPNIDIAIYNDGVPSMMLVSEEDVYNVLHGIEDPMSSYPPNAEEAAELDAADEFVEAMALLALLEEREEMARENFSFCKKRWEARRAEGLRGRPHPAKFVVNPVVHLTKSATPLHQDVKTLVRYMHASRMMDTDKMQQSKHMAGPKKNKMPHVQRRIPIQQPRKQN